MTNPMNTITMIAHSNLADLGVASADHRSEKLKTLWWYAPAAVLLLLALGFSGLGVYYVFSNQLTLLVAVVLLVPTGLCALGAILCATQADSEALSATVSAVGSLVKFGRG